MDSSVQATFAHRRRVVSTFGLRQMPATRKPPKAVHENAHAGSVSRLTSFGQPDASRGRISWASRKGRAHLFVSFRALRRQVFVSRGLPRAEGRKFAEACGEGRPTVVTTELLNEASRRPSGQRAAASFHAAERRSASRRDSWFAPVGANCASS